MVQRQKKNQIYKSNKKTTHENQKSNIQMVAKNCFNRLIKESKLTKMFCCYPSCCRYYSTLSEHFLHHPVFNF